MKYIVSLNNQSDQTVEADEFYILGDGNLFFDKVEGVDKADKGLGWSTMYAAKRETVACYSLGVWKSVRKDGEGEKLPQGV